MTLVALHFLVGMAGAADKVPSLQELEAIAAEERRKRAFPLDCLAGVCLGDTGSYPTEKIVTVAGEKVSRRLTFCGGQVVEIQVFQAWIREPHDDLHVQHDSGYFLKSSERAAFVLSEQAKMGWDWGESSDPIVHTLKTGGNTKTISESWGLKHSEKQGSRLLIRTEMLTRLSELFEWEKTAAKLALISRHPNMSVLCTLERQEGL
jgi:hypothetical protein